MRCFRFYLNLSIKYKILASFYLLIILTSLLLGIYSFYITQNYVLKKVSLANIEIVKQIDNTMNFLQKDMIDISTYLCIDSHVQSVLANKNNAFYKSPESEFNNNSSLDFIRNLVASKSYISIVALYGNNQDSNPYRIVNDASSGFKSSINKSSIYKSAVQLKGKPVWFSIEKSKNEFIINTDFSKVALGRVVYDYNKYSNIGFLLLCVNEQAIYNMYASNLQSENEGIVITDSSGNLISHAGSDFYKKLSLNNLISDNKLNQSSGYLMSKVSEQNMLITYSKNNTAGWNIFYFVPSVSLSKEVNSIKTFTFIVIILCLLLSLPIALLLSSYLTAPIKQLLNSMGSFQEGNFNEQVSFKYNDEIGMLGTCYNKMVMKIKDLIESVYISQLREKESELNALQAQINPHFLYNTLETIYWEAEECKQKSIANMVIHLSKLFRLSLNRGKSFTAVTNEIELIQHYLFFQKLRFKNRLDYEIDIDKRIVSCIIPKLILQPFVENAIIHGIEKRPTGGKVLISGVLQEGNLKFVIKDNGIGFETQNLENSLLSSQSDNIDISSGTGGYAIKNVNERLQLNFKDNYSLKFSSCEMQGTLVEIIVPIGDSQILEDN